MAIDLSRRGLLRIATALPFAGAARAHATTAYLAAGRELATGMDYAFGLSVSGDIVWRTKLPARGHGFARLEGTAIVFGRRPGTFALILDLADGAPREWLRPAPGHVFAGHGAFLDDGGLAIVEYAREDAAGAISIRDGKNPAREIARRATHGIDPHEMLRVGDELVVANGGIPEGFLAGRDDPDLCRPSLARFDLRTGKLTDLAEPPKELRRVSLRHLAVAQGRVMIAGQDQGAAHDAMPLLIEVSANGLIHRNVTAALQGYAGSIATGGGGLCLTSPRANRALILHDDARADTIALRDVCGAAPDADGFFLSGGAGDLAWSDGNARRHAGIAFDNHMLALARRTEEKRVSNDNSDIRRHTANRMPGGAR